MPIERATQHEFWWSGDRTQRFWIEQLKTDAYGDKLTAPDTSRYATMRGVEVGDIVFRWYSERHPEAGRRLGGIYAASKVIGQIRRSEQLWDGQSCNEIPLAPRSYLRDPILLRDLKDLEAEFHTHQTALATAVQPSSPYSLCSSPKPA
ncbi:hypothetical protein ACTXPS_18545 [Brachybacterium tyrofermentans]|uniref:hypothetical protein n=1 Tax=Brachybacterium tyrofermentans TaxID=47848 RepID=UPI003FCFB2F7